MRAEIEDVYGQRLGEIGPAADKIQGGFSRDDGASVRKVRFTLANAESIFLYSHRHTMVFELKWMKPRGTTEK